MQREKCSRMEITELVTFHVREHKKFMLKAQKVNVTQQKSHCIQRGLTQINFQYYALLAYVHSEFFL